MKKNLLSLIFAFTIVYSVFPQGEIQKGILFQFKQEEGSATSHLAEVMESAYINDLLSNKTKFINRLTTTVMEDLGDGAARLKTKYMITQNTFLEGTDKTLSWGEEDTVNISRRKNGQLYDSDTEGMPSVVNVPSFPDYPVKIGESWQMPGEEVHDCKDLFQMTELIRIPFTATYTYSGNETRDNKNLNVIDVSYEFSQSNRKNRIYTTGTFLGIQGHARQKIYWDSSRNELDYYEETFEIEMFDTQGNSYRFEGTSSGNVTEYKSMNTDEAVQQIQETVAEFELEDVSVVKGDKGLTISLENIQFEADSDVLLNSEKEKLRKIGKILSTVQNDLLITGHCARWGSESSQQTLSEERAESVASFLVQEGIRDQYHVFTQGMGAREPVDTNETSEGRARNRRVEIIIMD